MLVGLPEGLEGYRVLERVDVIVLGEFEGERELELRALLEVLEGVGTRRVRTPWAGEGLVIPPWRKRRDWRTKLLPYEVEGDFELLLWFQSPHPCGGVPDIMISPPPWELKGGVLKFSGSPAWRLPQEPLGWRPEVVVEVKRRPKSCKKYLAPVRIMAVQEPGEAEGWEVVRLGELGRRVREVLEERWH
ncbi:hypothetical protein [Ignicoccus hospitalis]|uniref:Uncharacterized protein n=1 Tax=Ignicoccus hospitalis (strain KIN4/I / DSM 18386 / JCM 14125) TaxID=453591 RepID=A8ABB2_IGNH4|nr:hypothetical protein [Ignicoccus hospitalis]ABU82214.1 hypothetical protein Igni_1035 [Ignicoccus hospitalis KIN4/I]HIH90150.1 hypothetical protein [Desulfurococcaceae archaeon]